MCGLHPDVPSYHVLPPLSDSGASSETTSGTRDHEPYLQLAYSGHLSAKHL